MHTNSFKTLCAGLGFNFSKVEKDIQNIKKETYTDKSSPTLEFNKDLSTEDINLDRHSKESSSKTLSKKRKFKDVSPISLPKTKKKKFSKEKLAQIHEENVRHLRNVHHIHVDGSDIPEPVTSFSDLVTKYGLSEKLVENIPYSVPTPIQMQAIPLMLMKRELIAFAPTGSGKTAAFVIPLIHHLNEEGSIKSPQAVILAPTRELAAQITSECDKMAKGLEITPHLLDPKSVEKPNFKCDILITTPNKLIYLLKEDPCPLDLSNVKWLVIDECDKLFEEGGKGFRKQLAYIFKSCDNGLVRRAMFSATYMYDVEKWAQNYLDSLATVSIGQRNSAVSSVKQELMFVGQEKGKLLALEQTLMKGYKPPVLVFVNTKEQASLLYDNFRERDPNVGMIHSDLNQSTRDVVMDAFRTGRIPTLICTELLGRGIDVSDINLVINYDPPSSVVSYIHRIGRTGRAGKEGHAITFYTEADFASIYRIAKVIRAAGGDVPDYLINKDSIHAIMAHDKMMKQRKKKALQKRLQKEETSLQANSTKSFNKNQKPFKNNNHKKNNIGDKTKKLKKPRDDKPKLTLDMKKKKKKQKQK